MYSRAGSVYIFFFQAEDGIRDGHVTGVQTCALPICTSICLPRLATPTPANRSTYRLPSTSYSAAPSPRSIESWLNRDRKSVVVGKEGRARRAGGIVGK